MLPLISLLMVVALSLTVTRMAAVALTYTGLSSEAARSTGVGYTTSESESVVNHPVRRRIVMLLMLLGNAGIVTAASTLILTFVDTGGANVWVLRLLVLLAGLALMYGITKIPWVDRQIHRLIESALRKWTKFDVRCGGTEGDRKHDEACARKAKAAGTVT